MNKTLLLAAVAAGAFALSGASAVAQPRSGPASSLSNSCQNIQTLNTGYVTAECRDGDGRYRWSAIYEPDCRSDIINRNGVMACDGGQTRPGGYVQQRERTDSGGLQAVVGVVAQLVLGDGGRAPYQDETRYPVWGEPGYGDARSDDRFGEQGWGYGAQGEWVTMSRRATWLDRRISRGEAQGRLTAGEGRMLRADMASLTRQERRFSRNGLSVTERADLDRRFDRLSQRVRLERRDDNQQGWMSINERQANLDERIDAGVRDRSLTGREAESLRADYRALQRTEVDYRRDGLTAGERGDLDRRFTALSDRIRTDRSDDDRRWSSIDERQGALDARIDAGVNDRSLSRTEAASLRSDFQAIARMETEYRRDGLTTAERIELDRRFDALSARIRTERRGS